MPELTLTIDPVEHRGFEYQTGISFIFFARGVRGELGRGGRYESGSPTPQRGLEGGATESESSTGFSLFMDSSYACAAGAGRGRRVFLPAGLRPGAGGSVARGRLGDTARA